MDVGHGQIINDRWIPDGVPTGLLDINGDEICTRDKVSLTGCGSRYAIVGRDSKNIFMLFFGREDASVGWWLDERTIKTHNIRVVTEVE